MFRPVGRDWETSGDWRKEGAVTKECALWGGGGGQLFKVMEVADEGAENKCSIFSTFTPKNQRQS